MLIRRKPEFSRFERVLSYFGEKPLFVKDKEFHIVCGGGFCLGFDSTVVLGKMRRRYEKKEGYAFKLKEAIVNTNEKEKRFVKLYAERKHLYPAIDELLRSGYVVNPFLLEAIVVDFVELVGTSWLGAQVAKDGKRLVFLFPGAVMTINKEGENV